MNFSESFVARRYARAFVNVFYDAISVKDFFTLNNIMRKCRQQKGFSLFMNLSIIPRKKKVSFIKEILKKEGFAEPWDILIEGLAKHKRISIFFVVMHYIERFYMEMSKIIKWDISSSCSLEEWQKNAIENFISKKTNKKALCNYRVSQSLIAGIRAKSDNWLWEYSIEKKLRDIKKIIIK